MSRLADHAQRFIRTVRRYARCCVRMEKEFRHGRLRVTDIELVYCSSFLSVCSRWETFLEDVLFEAVCGADSSVRGNWRHATFRTRDSLRDMLTHGGRFHLKFGTIEDAVSWSSFVMNEGRPISAVSDYNRTLIGQGVRIRNAIAHDSIRAKKNFKKKVPGVAALPNSKRTPGAFLRHEFRRHPGQRRYEIYFGAYSMAANEIANAW